MSMLFPISAALPLLFSLQIAEPAASLPEAVAAIPEIVEPEAILADRLPDQFIQPDAEQITIAEDRMARMTVPVSIEGGGPFDFIIDTAAQRTILSTEVAGSLTLELEDEVNIIALAGSTIVQTVYVPELTLGSRSYGGIVAPNFPVHQYRRRWRIGSRQPARATHFV